MEIRATWLRALILIFLLAGFWWIGGFELSPTMPKGAPNARALLYRIALFVIGAGCATIVEHEVGNLDRTSLRWLYILLGIILMTAAVTWTRALRGSEISETFLRPHRASAVVASARSAIGISKCRPASRGAMS